MKTEIWYVVENGGDGSVYTKFVDSKELAELLDSFEDERYDEAVGSLTIESKGGIEVEGLITIHKAIEEASEDLGESWWDEDDQEKLDALNALKKELDRKHVGSDNDDGYC